MVSHPALHCTTANIQRHCKSVKCQLQGLTARQACHNAAGQAFYQKGLSNCNLNTSQPAGTVLNITFSVMEPGRPDLSANVTRYIVLTCATGKLVTPCSRHTMPDTRCTFCRAAARC